MSLTIGLHAPNLFAGATPAAAMRLATLAEELGYDSLWVADHVALPTARVEESSLGPQTPLLDPVASLAYYAAHTERILLGTGCVVLPQRHPVVLAKQLASVDVLSEGRLLFGVGVGYLEQELRAVGVEMRERAARTDEYLAAIRSLWYDEKPSYHGRFVSFEDVDARPRPHNDHVPVVIGGHSPAAHRRAASYGDEWFGYLVGLRTTEHQLRSLRVAQESVGRRGAPLKISICPSRPLTPERVAEYAALGVDRLIVSLPFEVPLAQLESCAERNAPERLGAIPA